MYIKVTNVSTLKNDHVYISCVVLFQDFLPFSTKISIIHIKSSNLLQQFSHFCTAYGISFGFQHNNVLYFLLYVCKVIQKGTGQELMHIKEFLIYFLWVKYIFMFLFRIKFKIHVYVSVF